MLITIVAGTRRAHGLAQVLVVHVQRLAPRPLAAASNAPILPHMQDRGTDCRVAPGLLPLLDLAARLTAMTLFSFSAALGDVGAAASRCVGKSLARYSKQSAPAALLAPRGGREEGREGGREGGRSGVGA